MTKRKYVDSTGTEIIWYYLYFHGAFKDCPKYKAYLYHSGKLEGFLEGNSLQEILDNLMSKASTLGLPKPLIAETICP
jgi:hypothetical protein